jgi:D-amino-acid oxidase
LSAPSPSRVVVVGAGVIGMSCAVRLLEAGYQVELWAREFTPHTTSDVAAALWYPYAAGPRDRVETWARRSYRVFTEFARLPHSGVRILEGIELTRALTEPPRWGDLVRDLRPASPAELPAECDQGICFSAPLAEMPRFGQFLLERVQRLGGIVRPRALSALSEGFGEADLVINCTGLGARDLAEDPELYPVRGEVLLIACEGVDRFILDEREERLTYVIPRSRDCVVGGTAEVGQWSLAPDSAKATAFLSRAVDLVPALRHAKVLGHQVGLRPGREAVRLEAERLSDGWVIHNYGHGGAGVTLAFGCAEEVLSLARQVLGAAPRPPLNVPSA